MIRRRKTALLIPAVAIGIFLLIFIPIIGGSAQMVIDAVGFRGEENTIELRNPITFDGDFSERLIVHRDWSVRELVLHFDAEAQSAKVYLIKDGFRTTLGEERNVAKAVFSNSYEDMDGNQVIEPFIISNQLDYDLQQYLMDEEVSTWIEIEVRTSIAITMTITIIEDR